MKPDLYYVLKRGNEYMTCVAWQADGTSLAPSTLSSAEWSDDRDRLRADLSDYVPSAVDRSNYRIVRIIRKGSLTWTLREVNKTLQALRPLMEPTWMITR